MARKNQKSTTGLRRDVLDILRLAHEAHEKYIHLGNNGFTEIPEELFDLIDLEHITLDNNELKTVSERLWDLPRLRVVNLIGNPIEFLPNRPGLMIDGA